MVSDVTVLNTSDSVATDRSGGVVTDGSGVSVTIHEYTIVHVSICTVLSIAA